MLGSGWVIIYPIQVAVLLWMKASMFGMLHSSPLTSLFFMCCSLTWLHFDSEDSSNMVPKHALLHVSIQALRADRGPPDSLSGTNSLTGVWVPYGPLS